MGATQTKQGNDEKANCCTVHLIYKYMSVYSMRWSVFQHV